MKKLILLISIAFATLETQAQVIWDKNWPDNTGGYINKLIETTDSAYFVLSNYSYAKINKNGDTIYSTLKSNNNFGYNYYSCAPLYSGLVAVAGMTGQQGFLRIINKNGTVQGTKYFHYAFKVTDIAANGRSIYVALGQLFNNSNTVLKILSSLDSTWSSLPNQLCGRLLLNSNNELIGLSTTGQMIRFDVNTGAILSQKQTFKTSLFTSFGQLLEKDNAYYYQYSTSKQVKISMQGDSLSEHNFTGNATYRSFVAEPNGFTFLTSESANWQFNNVNNSYNSLFNTSFDVSNNIKTTATILKDGEGYYLLGGSTNFGGAMRLLKYKSTLITGLQGPQVQSIPKTLVRIYTPLGQAVKPEEVREGMYIYHYSDGSTSKVMKVEN